ncbi:hypothetical protein ACVWYU_005929 [Pseudomonas sp. TE12234]
MKSLTRKADGSAFYVDGNATDHLLDRSRVADRFRGRQIEKIPQDFAAPGLLLFAFIPECFANVATTPAVL